MGFYSDIIVYVLIWWTVFFIMLPIGIVPEKQKVKGAAEGAPKAPHMMRRMGMTTLVTTILYGISTFINYTYPHFWAWFWGLG